MSESSRYTTPAQAALPPLPSLPSPPPPPMKQVKATRSVTLVRTFSDMPAGQDISHIDRRSDQPKAEHTGISWSHALDADRNDDLWK